MANSLFWCDAIEAILLGFQHYILTLLLCLIAEKIEENAIERKYKEIKKIKENKKNRLKLNKLFLLLQTPVIYFNLSI